MKLAIVLVALLPACLAQIPGGCNYSADDGSCDTWNNYNIAQNALNNDFPQSSVNGQVTCCTQVVAGRTDKFFFPTNNGECIVEVFTNLDGQVGAPSTSCGVNKRQTGAQGDASFDDQDVQDAAKVLEKQANLESNSLFLVKAAGATEINKQVINGLKIEFKDLELKQTTCTASGDADTSNCEFSDDASANMFCSAVLIRAPSDGAEFEIQMDTYGCRSAAQKRQVGGYQPLANDLNEDEEASAAFEEFVKAINNINTDLTKVKVNSEDLGEVSFQVVAGINYRFEHWNFYSTDCAQGNTLNVDKACNIVDRENPVYKNCRGTVYANLEDPTGFTTTLQGCDNEVERRQTGGEKEITLDVNDEKVQWALNSIDDGVDRSAVSVIKATQQTVAGIKYSLKLRVTVDGQNDEICDISFVDQAWLETRTLLSAVCVGGVDRRQIANHHHHHHESHDHNANNHHNGDNFQHEDHHHSVGGGSEITLEVDDEKVQWALNIIDDDGVERKAVSVIKATQQTVAGIKYSLTLKVTADGQNDEICDVVFVDQAWNDSRTLYSAKCQ